MKVLAKQAGLAVTLTGTGWGWGCMSGSGERKVRGMRQERDEDGFAHFTALPQASLLLR